MASAVKGMDELSKNLASLGDKLGHKALRETGVKVTQPVVMNMKAAAPVGKVGHKTYKGRFVSPGFLKKSIVKRSRAKNGRALITIGVKPEAFYGVLFLDAGITVKQRKGKPIKPYTISGRKWFKKVFILGTPKIERDFSAILKDKIKKAIR